MEHFPGVGFACSTQKSGLFGSLSSRPSGETVSSLYDVLISLSYLVSSHISSISSFLHGLMYASSPALLCSVAVRNAHLAESQAELVATNVARYLSLSPSGSGSGTAKNMLSYPRGAFGVTPAPLLACVSLGEQQFKHT